MGDMEENRPNILVVLTDQQHADMLGGARDDQLETPAMDELAKTGLRFDRTYCTNPVCSPSRFSLMTGRFPSDIDLLSNDRSHVNSVPEEVTRHGLGHLLRDAGYETAYGGKVHLPEITVEDLGFRQISTNARAGLADACVEYLQENPQEPFCLVASFINPHDICYMAIRDYREANPAFDGPQSTIAEETLDEALALPDNLARDEFFEHHCPPLPANHEPQTDEPEAIRELLERRPFRRFARDEWSDERWRLHRWAYARLTEMVDAHVDRLLTALEESGLEDDTIVIFTSDHGDMDASHRMEHKTAFYEESVRVPLIIRQPGSPVAGSVDGEHLVSNGLDLLPTICDYAETDPPDHCSGRSVRPLVVGRSLDDWRRRLRVESSIGEMVVTDRYKYARYNEGEHREQLYDLQNDPGETRNAAEDQEHAEVVADLETHLSEV